MLFAQGQFGGTSCGTEMLVSWRSRHGEILDRLANSQAPLIWTSFLEGVVASIAIAILKDPKIPAPDQLPYLLPMNRSSIGFRDRGGVLEKLGCGRWPNADLPKLKVSNKTPQPPILIRHTALITAFAVDYVLPELNVA